MDDMKNYKSLGEALDDLKKRGYENDFEPQSFCLYCNSLDLRLEVEEFKTEEVYHFEGDFSSNDNAVVYALISNTGVKGTIVDRHGAFPGNIS
jgi:hypothetical protein